MPLGVVSRTVRVVLAVTAGVILAGNLGNLATRWLACVRTLPMFGIIILTVIGMRRRYGRAAGQRDRSQGGGAGRRALPEPAPGAGDRSGVPGQRLLRR